MFEKVNPSHPDKIADRIAGAIVDYAYTLQENPNIAVEVLIGHSDCNIIIETSVCDMEYNYIWDIINRITNNKKLHNNIIVVPQDVHLNNNQKNGLRCGDNGIFKGVPITDEQIELADIAEKIYQNFPTDGKYILDGDKFIICQSQASTEDIKKMCPNAIINPIGDWTGGIDVDSGATNRKLGSDMGDSITGGGLHGKDLSKADVSVNIYAFLKAQETGKPVELSCAIGDDTIDGKPYSEIVEIARKYIEEIGGFEKFAEWGLIKKR